MTPLLNVLAKKLKPTLVALVGYLVVLSTGAIISVLSPFWGAWYSIVIILANLGYLYKVSDESKRRVVRDILPTLATLLVAYLLGQSLDYVWGMLSLVVLLARLVDVDSRPPMKKHSYSHHGRRTFGGSRRR